MSGRVAKRIRREMHKLGIDPASALFRQSYKRAKREYVKGNLAV